MEVSIDTIVLTPSSLRLGCVVRGPKDAWVRFTTAELPLELLPYDLVNEIARRVLSPHAPEEDESLF